MRLRDILEMTTSAAVGSNLIPQRWLRKFLKMSNGPEKDLLFFTKIRTKNEVR